MQKMQLRDFYFPFFSIHLNKNQLYWNEKKNNTHNDNQQNKL